MTYQLIILGAGAPEFGERPSALFEPVMGSPLVAWVAQAACRTIEETIFVAGYGVDQVRQSYPTIQILENEDWHVTGSGASLLTGLEVSSGPLLVCYSDILFRKQSVDRMLDKRADVVIAWDSGSLRPASDVFKSQSIVTEWVNLNSDNEIVHIGSKARDDCLHGRFIGLVWFSSVAVEKLKALTAFESETLRSQDLPDCVEFLRNAGLSVGVVDVAGDWAEISRQTDVARFVLGTKAESLERLRYLVTKATIEDQVSFTVAEWRQRREGILDLVARRFEERPLIVRSSALTEDTFSCSNAGSYASVLHVISVEQLVDAIEEVINSYANGSENDQVLIQPMVEAVRLSGVVFTRTLEHLAPWYVINYSVGDDTTAITSGSCVENFTQVISRNANFSEITFNEKALSQLLSAIQEIEALLASDSLDVEFAVSESDEVHILQVRPLTNSNDNGLVDGVYAKALIDAKTKWIELARPVHPISQNLQPCYGIMPDWNPAEIVGTAPGALATSLYKYVIMNDIWAQQRAEFGYRDVRPTNLLVEFMGRPYVDVRASFSSLIPKNMDEEVAAKLISFYLGRLKQNPELHDKVEFEVLPTCLSPNFKTWKKRILDECDLDEGDIEQLHSSLAEITRAAFSRYADDLKLLEQLSSRMQELDNHCFQIN